MRAALAAAAIRFAHWLSPCEATAPKPPPPKTYDVSVRLHGRDRVLGIGDRFVRLPLSELSYFTEMMLVGWAAEVRNADVVRWEDR